jgi:hypothetical protein
MSFIFLVLIFKCKFCIIIVYLGCQWVVVRVYIWGVPSSAPGCISGVSLGSAPGYISGVSPGSGPGYIYGVSHGSSLDSDNSNSCKFPNLPYRQLLCTVYYTTIIYTDLKAN